MLSCKEVAERASALIDGELGAFEALQIRLHLAMCKGCGVFIGQMRMTERLTRAVVETEDHVEADDGRILAILSELHKAKQSGG